MLFVSLQYDFRRTFEKMVSFPVTKFYGSDGEDVPNYSALRTELINATTEKKAAALAQRFAFDFLPQTFFSVQRTCTEDILDARATFALALSLRGLLDNNNCSIKSLESLGFEAQYLNGFEASSKAAANRVQFEIGIELQGQAYKAFIGRAIDDATTPVSINELVGISDIGGNNPAMFYLASVGASIGEEGQRAQIKQMIDELFSLHLFDVRIASIDGGHELRTCGSVLSSIWLDAMQSFTEGRAGRCVVCGKPFISARERGNVRKYCSGACNKRAQRNQMKPGEAKPTR